MNMSEVPLLFCPSRGQTIEGKTEGWESRRSRRMEDAFI